MRLLKLWEAVGRSQVAKQQVPPQHEKMLPSIAAMHPGCRSWPLCHMPFLAGPMALLALWAHPMRALVVHMNQPGSRSFERIAALLLVCVVVSNDVPRATIVRNVTGSEGVEARSRVHAN